MLGCAECGVPSTFPPLSAEGLWKDYPVRRVHLLDMPQQPSQQQVWLRLHL